jgi:predicted ATPase/serine phosphatase RsbU (regulator of sigma subunit)
MPLFPGYNNCNEIYKSGRTTVCRGFDPGSSRSVILKKFCKPYPSAEEIAAFFKEYDILKKFSNEGVSEGVVEAYDKFSADDTHFIVLEDIGSLSVDKILDSMKLSVEEFLNLALKITEITGNIHKRNIIHKDINPSNIIWNMEKDIVRIIDFGISTVLPREIMSVKNPGLLEGTIAYISPEQTGRMNRSLDYRTDFYSLGVTFYRMLTGRLPFESDDMLKMVHSHIAVEPVYPSELDSSIPEPLSRIIMKLLAKNAEDRYRSAFGLKADLEIIRDRLKAGAAAVDFVPGSFDAADKIQIPEKLYGRENETASLLNAFDRVIDGPVELTLVSGAAGIGKSVLINEIQKPVAGRRGYFISGKFERLKKDVPYSAITLAFNGLARQILSGGGDELPLWKEKILSAAGQNGKVLTDMFSMFELIIGVQPELPDLGPVEFQNRFEIVMLSIVKVLADPEHPLVIFIDDLQWADPAGLDFLKLIASDSGVKNILLIGTFRPEETPASHPLMLMLDEITKTGAKVNSITLPPLTAAHADKLLKDTLQNPAEDTMALAETLIEKTGGNPFFINEFIKSQYAEGNIEFSFGRGWTWNLEAVGNTRATANVADLIAAKITELPEDSGEILKLASCAGSSFDLNSLAAVTRKTENEILSAMYTLVNNGMVVPVDNTYQFIHDRVMEAAYSLIPDNEKEEIHYILGRKALENLSRHESGADIFFAVNHLNAGIGLVRDPDERHELAGLNLDAGKRALASNAYRSALSYFRSGMNILPESSWADDYAFTLDLYCGAAASAQLCAEYDLMEEYIGAVIDNARTFLDTIRAYEARISAHAARSHLIQGIQTGLYVLKRLGITIPEKPGTLRIIYELLKVRFLLRGSSMEALIDTPQADDPGRLAVMRIISGMGSAVYMAAPQLIPLLIFHIVKLSVLYGISVFSPYSYAGLGLIHCGVIGDIPAGSRYGSVALRLLEKLSVRESRSKVLLIYWCFVSHWQNPIRDSLAPFLEAYRAGLDEGDLYFAALSANAYSCNLFYAGADLASVKKEMEEYTGVIRKLRQQSILVLQVIPQQAVLNLMGYADDPCVLSVGDNTPGQMLQEHKTAGDESALFALHYFLMYLNYLFGNYGEALMNAESAETYLDAVVSSPYIPLFYFYDSLIRAAVCRGEKNRWSFARRRHLKKMRRGLKKMKKWALHSPSNYRHKYHLMKAEAERISGSERTAGKNYGISAKLARENSFFQEEALALELTAEFWLELGEVRAAGLYMAEARSRYLQWGASSVAEYIEKKYSGLLMAQTEAAVQPGSSLTQGTSGTAAAIDMETVIKISQALSMEIDLDKLLSEVMRLSIENAGARKGFLILENENDGTLYVEAEGSAAGAVRAAEPRPVGNSRELPSTVIQYVHRTGETVVLNDARAEGPFSNDPYISAERVMSLLCMPVTHKGKTSGILYLENNLTAGVFTPGRHELLGIMASQAAISIENARLMLSRENSARLGKEMEMAEKIQRSLLPEKIPELQNVRIAYKYIAMMGVGGDFVNINYNREADRVGLFICDVSGHGVSAAITASMISFALDLSWKGNTESPSKIFKDMSRSLKGKMGGNFFTGCICSIELSTGILTMACAGHPPLIIIRNDGSAEMMGAKGRLINEFIESNSEDAVVRLNAGDIVVLYTDGISEAENPEREMVGQDDNAFLEWMKSHYESSSSVDDLCENIYKGVISYTGKNRFDDDFTVLVLEYCPSV